MTAQLARLRIAGFKSFAEPVSLDILPGLTGIVGPNGCGKSNVVEALRWAMGETSARSLRGGEMDDVIFAGTTARASRNLAEVTITLTGDLPVPYEAEAELQVTRRIERGAGSAFRANGRELRARDVQTLYADLASGARSSGMVSQGRVAALVSARPEDRRQVLEEAAGITGLHARRHEAELKLRAAEQNLTRAEDLRTQLACAQEAMRKQARQAARYRNISDLVRAAEAEHLAVRLAAARAQEAAAGQACDAARSAEAEAACEAAVAGAALAEAEACLPAPREALAEAARILERRRVAAENLAAEAERAAGDAREAERRLLELEADHGSALRARADTAASVTRLQADADGLQAHLAGLPGRMQAAAPACEAAELRADAAQLASSQAAEAAMAARLAEMRARDAHAGASDRLATAQRLHEAAAAAHAAAEAAVIGPDALRAAATAATRAETAVAAAGRAAEGAEADRIAATSRHAEARLRASQMQAAHAAAARHVQEASSRHRSLADAAGAARRTLASLHAARPTADALAGAQAGSAAAQAAASLADRQEAAAQTEAACARQHEEEAARALADLRADAARADADLAAARSRAARLASEHEAALAGLAEAALAAPAAASLAEAATALSAAQQELARRTTGSTDAGRDANTAAERLAECRRVADLAGSDAAQRAGTVAGLQEAVAGQDSTGRTLLAEVDVPEGLEAAFGAALGDAADASLDTGRQRFWRTLPAAPPPAPPPGAVSLASLIAAPDALSRLLAYVALLPDGLDGDALQAALAPGMVAVTRQGASWRWDGHVTRAGAANPAALRLAQLRRLAEARLASAAAIGRAAEAAERLDRATQEAAGRAAEAARAHAMQAQADHAVRTARAGHERLATQAALAGARRAALQPVADRLGLEHASAEAEAARAREAMQALPPTERLDSEAAQAAALACAAQAALAACLAARQAARAGLDAARDHAAGLARQAADTDARIAAGAASLDDLTRQEEAAAARLAAAQADAAALPALAGVLAELAGAAAADAACRDAETTARAARAQAEAALAQSRAAETALRIRASDAASRHAAQSGLLARAADDLAQCDQARQQAEAALAELGDASLLGAAAEAAQAALEAARLDVQTARTTLAGLQSDARLARTSLNAAAADLAAWQARHQEAESRAATLDARVCTARATWQSLAASPAAAALRASGSAAALADAQGAHEAASHRVAAAEQRIRALVTAQRDGELREAACREAAIRAEAARAATASAVQAVLARAAERLGADAALPAAAEHTEAAEDRARRRLERLGREREDMGPVNLRAELELAELDDRAATLAREREELATAIAKLRGAIGHLNREGRARLTAVFTEVDRHFRTLFTRMMGGGRAHLALTGSEDPLLAGLEIYAEPPGKKLTALSLLSGGEQALTALSLIFAVFRCTPAPISVLDEVDAPLDDANVERFCTLLDDVVRDTGTRFLVVTHHQLTMSRMDRLFGVTMQERGVSRLLSVDLRRAVAMAAPVMQAAE